MTISPRRGSDVNAINKSSIFLDWALGLNYPRSGQVLWSLELGGGVLHYFLFISLVGRSSLSRRLWPLEMLRERRGIQAGFLPSASAKNLVAKGARLGKNYSSA